ncbi:hypothetical protein [Mycolicibacterium palauense]|uniref:hypothetical protein n=1 Tax=Mycolicibacterium palauense TaxID=2034511 RepID=UPI0011458AFD|nr:hypothetical protein [Mycolicibacterium palauense]
MTAVQIGLTRCGDRIVVLADSETHRLVHRPEQTARAGRRYARLAGRRSRLPRDLELVDLTATRDFNGRRGGLIVKILR